MSSKIRLDQSVTSVRGVGTQRAERLAQLGIFTVQDLLNHIPVRYKDKRELQTSSQFTEGVDTLAQGVLTSLRSRRTGSGRSLIEIRMRDPDGFFYISFFNSPYLERQLVKGAEYTVFGKVQFRNGLRLFTNPEIVPAGGDRDLRRIEPVYRCTAGVTTREFIKWITYALDNADVTDWLSDTVRRERKLCELGTAYRNIHFPKDKHWYQVARYRMIYDQLLTYQIALRRSRLLRDDASMDALVPDADIKPFLRSLPFRLTEGQADAIRDIESDLVSRRPMNRLVQGDVGSGKTVVAEAAIYKTVTAGRQAAFMAPTEILARQHFQKLAADFEPLGIRAALLVSGLPAKERRQLLEETANGIIQVLIGTHALLQDDVIFQRLSLVITDEQHRFGVNQRRTLVGKGAANVLVMSATPIPRTLAATVYGDMDFSVIRTMPAGRIPIITRVVNKETRSKAYQAILHELKQGNQGYVVAPSIEQDDDSGLASAEELYQEMKRKFRGFRVEMIHGRLDKSEKESIMAAFSRGEIRLLVSTVVIEVGIDVPGATIIVIENAERFGLAQLHQLRGRVGRSDKQSYCYLINHSDQEIAAERMRIMSEYTDGFAISEADYELRGAGDLMGTMQHGFGGSQILNLFKYEEILTIAGEDADRVIADPQLTDAEATEARIRNLGAGDNSDIL